jgi:hypothetical protein
MKVAIVAESPADEAALSRLVTELVQAPIEVIPVAVRHGSWPRIKLVLPNVIAEVYYHTDAEGIVVVVDSDDSPIHDVKHDPGDPANAGCRFCSLSQIVARTQSQLAQRPFPGDLQVALGMAVPSIEAWLLCGVDHQVSEASWVNERRQNRIPYSRPDLKRRLYGTDRPSLDHETAIVIREANRLVSGQLDVLAQHFPSGFGSFASQLRQWRSTPTS